MKKIYALLCALTVTSFLPVWADCGCGSKKTTTPSGQEQVEHSSEQEGAQSDDLSTVDL